MADRQRRFTTASWPPSRWSAPPVEDGYPNGLGSLFAQQAAMPANGASAVTATSGDQRRDSVARWHRPASDEDPDTRTLEPARRRPGKMCCRGWLDVARGHRRQTRARGGRCRSNTSAWAPRRRRGPGVLRRADADGRLPAMLQHLVLPADWQGATVPVPDAGGGDLLTAPDRVPLAIAPLVPTLFDVHQPIVRSIAATRSSGLPLVHPSTSTTCDLLRRPSMPMLEVVCQRRGCDDRIGQEGGRERAAGARACAAQAEALATKSALAATYTSMP